MPLVDIGATLTDESFRHDLAAVLARAGGAGVAQIVVTGASSEGAEAAGHLPVHRHLLTHQQTRPHAVGLGPEAAVDRVPLEVHQLVSEHHPPLGLIQTAVQHDHDPVSETGTHALDPFGQDRSDYLDTLELADR